MFGKKKTPVVAPAEGGAEARAKARRKKATRLPKGVKQLIGYDAMLRNGIASLGDGRWSATILFHDINYQLSPESHQMEIIDRWAKLINSFEAGQSVQIASYTRSRGVRELLADVMMDETGDSLDHYRLDYNRLAQGKLESVSRNTSTVKTLTVTVRESDEQAAVATLNALCNNLVSQMRSIDACKATRLDREHRLRLMAEVLRPGEEFRFDERRFEHQPGKPDTKDLVCPWSIDARNPTMLDIESLDSKYLHRTMWVSSLPPELSDQLVNDLTGLRARVDVSIHLAPMDRGESMTLVRRKNAEVKMQIMDQRRKNRKQGLDPDDLPDGLDPLQKGLVDQCVSNLYTRYRNQGGGVVQPTLQDLHDELQAGGDQVSRYLADALNPYITGSMSGFNGQTNVDLSNRFTVFDVSGLSGELRTFGMMVVIDQVWNRVIRNKANGRRTWLYVDEFHRFFSNQYAAAQFKDIYKRARKYGLGVTGITQNVEEILDLQDAREMLSNSDFLMLLSQNSTDADALCELLTLSEEQRQYFTGVLPGQGLMKIGSAYVPFDGRIPAGGDLYRLYSTTFQEGK